MKHLLRTPSSYLLMDARILQRDVPSAIFLEFEEHYAEGRGPEAAPDRQASNAPQRQTPS